MKFWKKHENNRGLSAFWKTEKTPLDLVMKRKKTQTYCVWGLSTRKIQCFSTGCCCQKWRNVARAWFRVQAVKQKGDFFFTYLSTSIVKLVTWCLSPETKILKWFLMLSGGMRRDSLNSVVTWMQKAPQRVPVHGSCTEQQQKLSGIGNKWLTALLVHFPL